jgi:flagellar hook-associated protein 2
MASVSSAARVDGVDLQGMVGAATAFARPQPGATAAHPASDTEADARISSAGKLRGATAALLDSAQRLTKPQTWRATTAASSNEQVLQAVSSHAEVGDYSVNVAAVATAQATSSATFSSLSTVIGIGTLNIELGNWNTSQTAFAMNPNWPKANVSTGPKDTSLEHIRDKINAAGVGVIATVVSDATGSRLVLRSTATGEANGFKVDASPDKSSSPDAAQALASLGFNPASTNQGASLVQAAQDAQVSIDGRAIQSPRNVIEDEVSGLRLRLRDSSPQDVTVSVRPDTTSIQHSVQAFATAYNGMVEQLSASDEADAGRATAQALQQRVTELLQPNTDPASLSSQLAGIGLHMNQGQLSLDGTAFGQALSERPQSVQTLFSTTNQQPGGLIDRLRDMLSETPASTASEPPAADTSASSQAGHAYRQRLLEQYTQPVPTETAATATEAAQPVALPENVA